MQSGKGSGSEGSRRSRRGSAGRAKNGTVQHGSDAIVSAPDEVTGSARGDGHHGTNARVWTGGNRILAGLPPGELSVARQSLRPITLRSGHVLYEQHSRIDRVYFPETAVVSLLSRMENQAVVEVGTIGNEGMVGISLFLGADVSVPEVIAQIPGTAQYMEAADFRAALDQLPRLRSIVAGCTHAFMTQVSQTAACNRLHGIEQRCARWLLLTHDRVGGADTFPLTHQFLSFMLGVRRAGVTEALGALKLAGLIDSAHGSVTVVDRLGLEAACCDCYAIVRRHAGAPFAPVDEATRELS